MQKVPVTVEEFQEYNEKDKNKKNSLVKEGGDYYIQHVYKQIKEKVFFLYLWIILVFTVYSILDWNLKEIQSFFII